jgi:RHS repeat-associated protein
VRGGVELAGHVWLRESLYAPAERSFVSLDPLPGLPGTAWFGNPYHYAANDPVGWADPLGLRPVTDAELRQYRDALGQTVWEQGADWLGDNYEYIVAGALVAGGVAVAVTGVGGPVGAAMISGGLMSMGASTGMQKLANGSVDVGRVLQDGVIGAAAGGLGALAGIGAGVGISRAASTGLGRVSSAAQWTLEHPIVLGAVKGTVESVTQGYYDRLLHGEDPFDPASLGKDALYGTLGGASQRYFDDLDKGSVRWHDPSPVSTPHVPVLDDIHHQSLNYGLDETDFGRAPKALLDAASKHDDAWDRASRL